MEEEGPNPSHHAGHRTGCTVALLSAFGCGAYGHPPELVARMFREALQRRWTTLQQVSFCILDDHNAGRFHNPTGNLRPFWETFRGPGGAAGAAPRTETGVQPVPQFPMTEAPFGCPSGHWGAEPTPRTGSAGSTRGPNDSSGADLPAWCSSWEVFWDSSQRVRWYWHGATHTATLLHPEDLRAAFGGYSFAAP